MSRVSMPWPTIWKTAVSRHAASISRCVCARSACEMSMTGGNDLLIVAPLRLLARLQPLGQQRVRIDLEFAVVLHVGLVEMLLHLAAAPGVEHVRGAADVRAADEHLRKRLRGRAIGENAADPAAEVFFLELDGVDVDAAIRDAKLRK